MSATLSSVKRTIWRAMGVGLFTIGLIGSTLALSTTSPKFQSFHPTQASSGSWLASEQVKDQTQPALLDFVPTYWRDVAPIIKTNCLGCHVQGGIAPFSLETPEDVIPRARTIQFAVQEGIMPPWLPGGDSPSMEHERKLSEREIAIIANWAWADAPLGTPPTAQATSPQPTATAASTSTSSVDSVTLDIGATYEPKSNDTDDFRCFVIDPKITEERQSIGYEVKPGNQKIVHHMIFWQISGPMIEEANKLDAQDATPGWSCFGGLGLNTSTVGVLLGSSDQQAIEGLGAWTPGNSQVDFPANTGRRIMPGSKIVVQIHYNLANGAGSDRTKIQLNFAPRGTTLQQLHSIALFGPVELPCPGTYPTDPNNSCNREAAYNRGDILNGWVTNILRSGLFSVVCQHDLQRSLLNTSTDGKTVTTCDWPVSKDAQAVGVNGHMHLLGKSFRIVRNPNGPNPQTLLDIPRWDYHWQDTFWLKTPIALKKGDTLRVVCEFDNSKENQPWIGNKQNNPRYVVWGEGTFDEMCLGGVITVR